MATSVLSHRRDSERLCRGEIHVWSAVLDRPPEIVSELGAVLSGDELERTRRFRFDRDRNRYTVGRGTLRTLLSRYLQAAPDQLRFTYDEHRKPELARPWSRLSFNVSHSGGLALYAICLDAEIGIDLELLTPEPLRDRVPEHFFSRGEVDTLRSLPKAKQDAAFLRCWTRKEAFLKARGDGLTLALDSFDVNLAEHEAPCLLRTAWDPTEAAEWSLHDLSSSFSGYAAGLAVRGSGWSVHVLSRHGESHG